MKAKQQPLTVVAAGGRWRDARGFLYVVTWVKKIGVLGYRRIDPSPWPAPGPAFGHAPGQLAEDDRELVSDVVKFVLAFVPAQSSTCPANG